MIVLDANARKVALTAHVATSVGWLGAVLAFLALAVVALQSADEPRVRAMALAMDTVARWVILPLALATLATGLLQGLGTEWGVLRHYWVVAKLLLTLVATAGLLLHLQPIAHFAHAAAQPAFAAGDLRALRLQLVVNAAAAVLVLLAATVLSVVKPRGLTRRGRRWRRAARP